MFSVEYDKEIGVTAAGTVHRFQISLWQRGTLHRAALDLLALTSGGVERYAPRRLMLDGVDYTIPATNTAMAQLQRRLTSQLA